MGTLFSIATTILNTGLVLYGKYKPVIDTCIKTVASEAVDDFLNGIDTSNTESYSSNKPTESKYFDSDRYEKCRLKCSKALDSLYNERYNNREGKKELRPAIIFENERHEYNNSILNLSNHEKNESTSIGNVVSAFL